MKRTGVIIILLILLLLSAGTNTYLYYDNKDALAKKELELVAMRDSLQRELLRIEDSLNNVVMTFQEENSALVTKITELEGPDNPRVVAAYSELNRIRRQLIQMTINEGGGDINIQRNTKDVNLSGIRKQLADAKVKIKDLTSQLDTLVIERNQAVADKEVAENEKESLGVENTELKERLEKGAIPQFGTLITSAYDNKKKIAGKAKNVAQFMITYDILENPMVTYVVEEDVTVRLIDPDGGIMTLNNKTLKDKSSIVTMKESVSFDGALQKVKWKFPNRGNLKGKLKKGKYTTELWTRDLLRQKNTFTLN